jgi:hypothetical protein
MSKTTTNWLAERVRCTVFFPANSPLPEPGALWKEWADDEPSEVISKPKEGLHVASGEFLGATLHVQAQADRVDFNLLAPKRETPLEPGEFPVAGEFGLIGEFAAIATKWLSSGPTLTRVAFGAILMEPVDSKEAGYHRMDELLPDVKVDEDARDFRFQINRRRESQVVPSLLLNRLSKWSVAVIQPMMVQFQLGGPVSSVTSTTQHAARLEVDINSAPEFAGSLPTDQVPDLFNELVALGIELSEKGDIP